MTSPSSDDLATMTVEARFDRPIKSISARSHDAGQYLARMPADCDSGKALHSPGSRRLSLPTTGIECLRYSVDLGKRQQGGAPAAAFCALAILRSSPTVWMWRPRLAAATKYWRRSLQVRAPQVFLPWEKLNADGTRYRLGTLTAKWLGDRRVRRSFSTTRRACLARTLRVALPNTNGRVELQPLLPVDREATANSIAGAYGTFPNANANVLLIPVGNQGWDKDSAVSFGRVVRDGGETIELMINQHQPDREVLRRSGRPIHEFSHLMLPYLNREQRWISEGFAQYYQNVFLARSRTTFRARTPGKKSMTVWNAVASQRPACHPTTRRAPMRDTRMKVYWSGASLALMADVEIRRRSGGNESLDSVLGQLQQCCLPSSL